jgi:hypothetical protein
MNFESTPNDGSVPEKHVERNIRVQTVANADHGSIGTKELRMRISWIVLCSNSTREKSRPDLEKGLAIDGSDQRTVGVAVLSADRFSIWSKALLQEFPLDILSTEFPQTCLRRL